MNANRRNWILGATGCGALLMGGCVFSAVLFFLFIESSPSSIDDPDLWYSIPGQLYVPQSRDCQMPWEELRAANARRCQHSLRWTSLNFATSRN